MPDSVMLNSYLMLYHIPLYHFPLYLIPDCPLECYNRFLFSVIPDSIISDSVIPDSCFDIPDSVMPNSGIPDSSFACYNRFRYTRFPAPTGPTGPNIDTFNPGLLFLLTVYLYSLGVTAIFALYLIQGGAKLFLHVWISRLSPTHQHRAANAQPISPDGTCVTELSRNFFARPCT